MAKRIDVSDLDIYYGDFLAVQGVNMTIKARSVTAFIGPSGCGKSTVLRSLNRMHEVIPNARVEGKIVVDGQSLYGAGIAMHRVTRLTHDEFCEEESSRIVPRDERTLGIHTFNRAGDLSVADAFERRPRF